MAALTFDVWVITDPAAPRGLAPYREALASGVGGWALSIRDHDADEVSIARTIESIADQGVEVPRFLAVATHARLETAARCGVGSQLAERGPSVLEARRLGVGQVAASVHDRGGIARRADEGADLVLLAPFGDVPGKGAPLTDVVARRLVAASAVPVFALGALRSREDVQRAFDLGCAGIAVRSIVATAPDGAAAIAQLRAWADTSRRERDLTRRSG